MTDMKNIQTVAVLGSGAMGRQIALNAAVNGFDVRLAIHSFPEGRDKARVWAEGFLAKSIEKGKMSKDEAEAALSRVVCFKEISETVKDADLVIEALLEDPEVKRDAFLKVNASAPKDAIIATNSSFIPSSRFAEDIDNPGRLCNVHYFNPAMLMKLVEIVRGEHTSDETIEAMKAFVDRLGKTYIIVNKEIEGFVVNRLLRACQNEAFYLYSNGIASYEDIDKGAELGLNYPMGPFRLLDMTGIDLAYLAREKKYEETGLESDKPPAFLTEKYEKGEYGRKSGKGWYEYPGKTEGGKK